MGFFRHPARVLILALGFSLASQGIAGPFTERSPHQPSFEAKGNRRATSASTGGGGAAVLGTRARLILGLVTDVDFAEDTIIAWGGEYSNAFTPLLTFDGGFLYWRTGYDTPFLDVTYSQLDLNGGVTAHIPMAETLFFDVGGRLGLARGTVNVDRTSGPGYSDSESSLHLTLVVGLTKVSGNMSFGFELRDPILFDDEDLLADDYLYLLGTIGFQI